jgi:LPXTG-motif cell wall-anchored protein
MGEVTKKGFPLIGAIFLALAAWKFLRGDNWVVWLILGLLLGGLGIFARKKGAGQP